MDPKKFSKEWFKQNALLIFLVVLVVIFYVKVVIDMIYHFKYAQLDQKDMYDFTYGGKLLLEGKNPYSEPDLFTRNHPPGLFFLYAILIAIFGAEYHALKIPTYIFAILTAGLVFYLTRFLIKKAYEPGTKVKLKQYLRKPSTQYLEEKISINISKKYHQILPWITTLLYLTDRAVEDRYVEGSYEAFTTFFFFLGFIFFFQNRHILAAAFWGISIITQLVAFFMWPFLLLHFAKKKNWKLFWIYCLTIVGIVGLSFLPFFIDDFEATVRGFLLLASRETTHYSFFWYYPDSAKEKLYREIFNGVSLWFFVQVSVYGLVLAFLLLKKTITKHNLINSIFIIYFTLPILTNSYGIRYLNWLAPVFYTYMVLKKKFLMVALFFFMSVFTIEWFFPSFPKNPWLMVFGAYFFSIFLIELLIIDLDTKNKLKKGAKR